MEITAEQDAEIQKQVLSKSKAVHDEMVEKERPRESTRERQSV